MPQEVYLMRFKLLKLHHGVLDRLTTGGWLAGCASSFHDVQVRFFTSAAALGGDHTQSHSEAFVGMFSSFWHRSPGPPFDVALARVARVQGTSTCLSRWRHSSWACNSVLMHAQGRGNAPNKTSGVGAAKPRRMGGNRDSNNRDRSSGRPGAPARLELGTHI
eukprot:tig00000057_g134.t1